MRTLILLLTMIALSACFEDKNRAGADGGAGVSTSGIATSPGAQSSSPTLPTDDDESPTNPWDARR